MNEDFALAFIKIPEERHDFLEILFLFLQCLILGFADEIQDFDDGLEFRSTNDVLVVLKQLGMDELLIVKLSDLVLFIHFHTIVIIPVMASQFLEQLEF